MIGTMPSSGSSTDLAIDIERVEDRSAAVLRCRGLIDGNTYSKLDDAVTALFQAGCRFFLVDLSDVSYVSSSGFGVLIWARKEAEEKGGGLALLSPAEQVRRTLGTLQIDKAVAVVETEAAGWQSLGIDS